MLVSALTPCRLMSGLSILDVMVLLGVLRAMPDIYLPYKFLLIIFG